MFTSIIRYGAYPIVAGSAFLVLTVLASAGLGYWPSFLLVVLAGVGVVAVLERVSPFEASWNLDHGGDTRADALHLLVSYLLIQSAIGLMFTLDAWRPDWSRLWPHAWPMWMQILLAGLILDLGLYAMHRASHASGLLWRLHAIHHSPERLYWLNGGRRHPLSALVLAGPGLAVLLALGATPIAAAAWMSFMTVHLAFQHANLDYRLGPARHVLGVAEMHRWHHKRAFEDAQVNFGEVLLIWDRLFGTYHDAPRSPGHGEVGLAGEQVPLRYLGQLLWPFRASPAPTKVARSTAAARET